MVNLTLKEIASIPGKTRDVFPPRCWINYYISVLITWAFIRLPITANQVTGLYFIYGIIGVFFMGLGGYWNFVIGILIYHFAIILDYVDGYVARIKNTYGLRGKFMDLATHEFHHVLMLLALGIGLYRMSGEVLYLYLGILMSLSRAFTIFIRLTLYKAFSDDVELMKKIKRMHFKDSVENNQGSFVQKVKAFVFEMLRFGHEYTLLFWMIVFGFTREFVILYSVLLPLLLVKEIVKTWRNL